MQGAHIFNSQPGALSSGFLCPRITSPTVKADDSLNLRIRSPNCSNVVSDRSISSSRVVPAKAEKKVVSERSRKVPFDLPPRSLIPRSLEFLWFRKSYSDSVLQVSTKPSTCKSEQGKLSVDTVMRSASGRPIDDLEDLQDESDLWGESDPRDFSSGSEFGNTRTGEASAKSGENIRRMEESKIQETDTENFWVWRPPLKSFLSSWNRSRQPDSINSVDAQIKQKVTEALVKQGAEALTSDLAGSKPASLWAIGQLLHWRSEQQEGSVGRELKTDVLESAAREAKIGACKECIDESCQLFEQGSGQAVGAPIEVPTIEVVHTASTLAKFLGDVYPSDLQRIGLMSVLCDMAYTIQSIEPAELEKKYRLKFRTSSFELKAKAAAEEKKRVAKIERAKEAKKLRADSSEKRTLTDGSSPNRTIRERSDGSAAAPPPLVPERKESFRRKKQNGVAAGRSDVETVLGEEAVALSSCHEEAMVSDFLASRGSRRGVQGIGSACDAGSESVGGSAAQPQSEKSSKPDAVCPCEWFVCDDEESDTRHFVFQGSDSLASWQTNVSFDPVTFEDPSLGVKVHRGIYDAAKALYVTIMPSVTSFVEERGSSKAKIILTGHSLGGSLATLLNLMLLLRGAVSSAALLPVHTFGSPSIMCGGDSLLEMLDLPQSHVQQVMMHRDLVPRAFSCTYPDHVAEVLRRMSSAIRDHTCLTDQKLMYAPMGTMLVLQPEATQSPFHPLLPAAPGLFRLRHPHQNDAELPHMRATCHSEVRAAQRAILNNPHPLEILADRGSYGAEGSISRDHDPQKYISALNAVMVGEEVGEEEEGEEEADVGAQGREGSLRSGALRFKSRRRVGGVGGSTQGVGRRRGLRARGPHPDCLGVTSGLMSGRLLFAANVGGGLKDSKRRLHSLIASKHVGIGF